MWIFNLFKKKKVLPKQPAAFKEKRFLPRWKISALAKIKWEGRDNYVPCEVRDLNMKGFSLVTTEKIPDGCTRAVLYFNDAYFFDIEIALIWHKEADCRHVYGARFTKIRDSDKEKIFRMMRDNFSSHLSKNL